MSAISGVSQSADTARLLALLVARNPTSDAATQKALAALEANQSDLQASEAALASGTNLDVLA